MDKLELIRDLVEALEAASGYMMNAGIDLETATKAHAKRTLDQGRKRINSALAKAKAALDGEQK